MSFSEYQSLLVNIHVYVSVLSAGKFGRMAKTTVASSKLVFVKSCVSVLRASTRGKMATATVASSKLVFF